MTLHPLLLVLVLLTTGAVSAQNLKTIAHEDTPAMAEARKTGVFLAQMVMKQSVQAYDKPEFPGIQAWLAAEGKKLLALDKDKPAPTWRRLDGDSLITHSSNFWQLFYEVVPADPGLAIIHAGTLMAAGDPYRAQIVLRLTLHRGDLGDETAKALAGMMQHCNHFMTPSNEIVQAGISLFDKGDRHGAMAKYSEAMDLWPLNGWAMYEGGLALMMEAKDPKAAKVAEAFAITRRIQPFQWAAWQGDVSKVPGMLNMGKVVRPLWEKSLKHLKFTMIQDELESFSKVLQEAEVDDLALVARQIMIVKRGRYKAEDHPFITTSLRRLVPGKQAETSLQKLAGGELVTASFFKAPVPGRKPKED